MNSSLKNSLILLPILAGISYAGLLLYQDYHQNPTSGVADQTKEQVGQILIVQNNVKRQAGDDVLWSNVEKNVPVYDKDSIRTGKDSQAVIKLADNSIIEIAENSLIVLEKSPENLNIRFKAGDLSTKNSGKNLQISVSGSVVSGEGADLKVTANPNAKTQVTVAKGHASLTDKNKKKTTLGTSEEADLDDEGVGTFKKITVTLKSPLDKTQIQTSKTRLSQPFTWQVNEPGIQDERLQISKSVSFINEDTVTLKGHQGVTALLKPGVYFWRVTWTDNDKPESTLPWQVTVGDDRRISLLYPENNNRFNLTPEENSVDLQWSSQVPAKLYVTEIATSIDFKNLAMSHTVKETKDQVKNLTAQTYYWRVKGFGEKNEELATSNTYSFAVTVKIPKLPELIKPADESIWTSADPVGFEWKKMDKATEYRILISVDEDQKEIAKTKEVPESIFSWAWPHQGTYFWSVKALNAKSQIIGQSEVHQFTVKVKDKGPAFELISPKDQTDVTRELRTNPEPVAFQWHVLRKLPGSVSLLVSANPEFQDAIKQDGLTKVTAPVTLTKAGIYYWKVTSHSEDGKIQDVSPVYSFNLKAVNTLLPPNIIEPAMKEKIEISQPSPVKFSWSAVPEAAQYHIIVTRTDQHRSSEAAGSAPGVSVLDRVVKETTVNSPPLPEGNYSWAVTSVDAQGEEGLAGHNYEFSIVPQEVMDAPKLNAPVVK